MRKIRPMQLALFETGHSPLPIVSAGTRSHHVVRRSWPTPRLLERAVR
jgi:hypothetical protein